MTTIEKTSFEFNKEWFTYELGINFSKQEGRITVIHALSGTEYIIPITPTLSENDAYKSARIPRPLFVCVTKKVMDNVIANNEDVKEKMVT